MLKKLGRQLFGLVLFWFARGVLSLRYRLEVEGLENLGPEASRGQGTLFLPNHPAEIDPLILEMLLWDKFQPRPLVVEHFYHLKGFKLFIDYVRAMPLPTMDTIASKWRGKKVEKQFNKVVEGLRNGENFLIYPSGRLKHTGLEVLGGASFAHSLLQVYPDIRIVLVRTSGLWGSMFSRALTGASPDFGKTFWKGFWILLKNGIFFTPRRHVRVEFELAPASFPRQSSRLEVNKFLEGWYNRYPKMGPEPLNLVSYAFWRKDLPEVLAPTEEREEAVAEQSVSQKIQQEVFKFISTITRRPADQLKRTMHLSLDLGLDSLDVVQLYVFLDERYEIKDLPPGELHTVEDVLQAAAGLRKGTKVAPALRKLERSWPSEERRFTPAIPEGATLQEVFLRSADRYRDEVACMDRISGCLTYRKLKMAALILARQMRALPGENVGVMLPSSVGAYLVILAILLARKVPVMLNWTTGVRALEHAASVADLKAVISSDRFLDRLENGDFGKVEEKFVLIEDVRANISWKQKLAGLYLSVFRARYLLRKLKLHDLKASSTAVVLFTSGTETLPKGVPLTHENLLSNQRACMQIAGLRREDILYGVLPPFHSFGFSVTGLLGLLAGVRVCYAPDPTDSHGMAHDIALWKPTIFCCAPSFIRALFRVADVDQLKSMRLVVSGAEKTPQELFDYVAANLPGAQLLEGYGITECSPVVTIDPPGEAHHGVGKPLDNLELMVIDPATDRSLAPGVEGEICIAGPSVFGGYLGVKRDPFLNLEGKRYYRSGDRGYIAEDGALILAGRLKRFVKIGGEMVSLAGLEEELLRLAHVRKWVTGREEGPPLAISVLEKEGEKPLIVLFTTLDVSAEEVNAALKECGYGKIVKIGEVKKIGEIPLTGTGKTHYRLLDDLLSK